MSSKEWIELCEKVGVMQQEYCVWSCKADTCSLNCKHYNSKERYYPPESADIRERLEELVLDNDYALTKVPNHSYELDDSYFWFDTTNMNRPSITVPTRTQALYLLISKLCDEIQGFAEKVKEVVEEVVEG